MKKLTLFLSILLFWISAYVYAGVNCANCEPESHENERSGTITNVHTAENNLAIAFNVQMENAIGGSGDDTLIGNKWANTLKGNGGADTLQGNQGSDTLHGGEGDDTYIWELGDGNDVIDEEGKGGSDKVIIKIPYENAKTILKGRWSGNDYILDVLLDGVVQGTLTGQNQKTKDSAIEYLELYENGKKIIITDEIFIDGSDENTRAYAPRVFNGTKVLEDDKKWEYVVSLTLVHENGYKKNFCTGSLINEYWVLTAAHCLDNNTVHNVLNKVTEKIGGMDYSKFTIQVGNSSYKLKELTYNPIDTENIILHPEWTGHGGKPFYDIALVKLHQPIKGVQPVKLNDQLNSIKPGSIGKIAGWGVTNSFSTVPTENLLEGEQKVLNVNKNLMEIQVAPTDNAKNTFLRTGDSGGPLMFMHGNEYLLSGIVSFGSTESKETFYTEIYPFISWIRKKIQVYSVSSIFLDDTNFTTLDKPNSIELEPGYKKSFTLKIEGSGIEQDFSNIKIGFDNVDCNSGKRLKDIGEESPLSLTYQYGTATLLVKYPKEEIKGLEHCVRASIYKTGTSTMLYNEKIKVRLLATGVTDLKIANTNFEDFNKYPYGDILKFPKNYNQSFPVNYTLEGDTEVRTKVEFEVVNVTAKSGEVTPNPLTLTYKEDTSKKGTSRGGTVTVASVGSLASEHTFSIIAKVYQLDESGKEKYLLYSKSIKASVEGSGTNTRSPGIKLDTEYVRLSLGQTYNFDTFKDYKENHYVVVPQRGTLRMSATGDECSVVLKKHHGDEKEAEGRNPKVSIEVEPGIYYVNVYHNHLAKGNIVLNFTPHNEHAIKKEISDIKVGDTSFNTLNGMGVVELGNDIIGDLQLTAIGDGIKQEDMKYSVSINGLNTNVFRPDSLVEVSESGVLHIDTSNEEYFNSNDSEGYQSIFLYVHDKNTGALLYIKTVRLRVVKGEPRNKEIFQEELVFKNLPTTSATIKTHQMVEYPIELNDPNAKVKVSGLPDGLRVVKEEVLNHSGAVASKTYKIVGVVERAQTKTLTFTATTDDGREAKPRSMQLIVEKYTPEVQINSFKVVDTELDVLSTTSQQKRVAFPKEYEETLDIEYTTNKEVKGDALEVEFVLENIQFSSGGSTTRQVLDMSYSQASESQASQSHKGKLRLKTNVTSTYTFDIVVNVYSRNAKGKREYRVYSKRIKALIETEKGTTTSPVAQSANIEKVYVNGDPNTDLKVFGNNALLLEREKRYDFTLHAKGQHLEGKTVYYRVYGYACNTEKIRTGPGGDGFQVLRGEGRVSNLSSSQSQFANISVKVDKSAKSEGYYCVRVELYEESIASENQRYGDGIGEEGVKFAIKPEEVTPVDVPKITQLLVNGTEYSTLDDAGVVKFLNTDTGTFTLSVKGESTIPKKGMSVEFTTHDCESKALVYNSVNLKYTPQLDAQGRGRVSWLPSLPTRKGLCLKAEVFYEGQSVYTGEMKYEINQNPSHKHTPVYLNKAIGETLKEGEGGTTKYYAGGNSGRERIEGNNIIKERKVIEKKAIYKEVPYEKTVSDGWYWQLIKTAIDDANYYKKYPAFYRVEESNGKYNVYYKKMKYTTIKKTKKVFDRWSTTTTWVHVKTVNMYTDIEDACSGKTLKSGEESITCASKTTRRSYSIKRDKNDNITTTFPNGRIHTGAPKSLTVESYYSIEQLLMRKDTLKAVQFGPLIAVVKKYDYALVQGYLTRLNEAFDEISRETQLSIEFINTYTKMYEEIKQEWDDALPNIKERISEVQALKLGVTNLVNTATNRGVLTTGIKQLKSEIFNNESHFDLSSNQEGVKQQIKQWQGEISAYTQQVEAQNYNQSMVESLKSTLGTLYDKVNSYNHENLSTLEGEILKSQSRLDQWRQSTTKQTSQFNQTATQIEAYKKRMAYIPQNLQAIATQKERYKALYQRTLTIPTQEASALGYEILERLEVLDRLSLDKEQSDTLRAYTTKAESYDKRMTQIAHTYYQNYGVAWADKNPEANLACSSTYSCFRFAQATCFAESKNQQIIEQNQGLYLFDVAFSTIHSSMEGREVALTSAKARLKRLQEIKQENTAIIARYTTILESLATQTIQVAQSDQLLEEIRELNLYEIQTQRLNQIESTIQTLIEARAKRWGAAWAEANPTSILSSDGCYIFAASGSFSSSMNTTLLNQAKDNDTLVATYSSDMGYTEGTSSALKEAVKRLATLQETHKRNQTTIQTHLTTIERLLKQPKKYITDLEQLKAQLQSLNTYSDLTEATLHQIQKQITQTEKQIEEAIIEDAKRWAEEWAKSNPTSILSSDGCYIFAATGAFDTATNTKILNQSKDNEAFAQAYEDEMGYTQSVNLALEVAIETLKEQQEIKKTNQAQISILERLLNNIKKTYESIITSIQSWVTKSTEKLLSLNLYEDQTQTLESLSKEIDDTVISSAKTWGEEWVRNNPEATLTTDGCYIFAEAGAFSNTKNQELLNQSKDNNRFAQEYESDLGYTQGLEEALQSAVALQKRKQKNQTRINTTLKTLETLLKEQTKGYETTLTTLKAQLEGLDPYNNLNTTITNITEQIQTLKEKIAQAIIEDAKRWAEEWAKANPTAQITEDGCICFAKAGAFDSATNTAIINTAKDNETFKQAYAKENDGYTQGVQTALTTATQTLKTLQQTAKTNQEIIQGQLDEIEVLLKNPKDKETQLNALKTKLKALDLYTTTSKTLLDTANQITALEESIIDTTNEGAKTWAELWAKSNPTAQITEDGCVCFAKAGAFDTATNTAIINTAKDNETFKQAYIKAMGSTEGLQMAKTMAILILKEGKDNIPTINYTTATPAHNTMLTTPPKQIIIPFSENIEAVSNKNITLYTLDGKAVKGWNTDSAVSIQGSKAILDMGYSELPYEQTYYIALDKEAFQDSTHNPTPDRGGKGVWEFSIGKNPDPCGCMGFSRCLGR
jgi:hypothetical protein